MKQCVWFKRSIALLFAAALLVTSLSGCAINEMPPTRETTTLEVGPEVTLTGNSPVALLNQGSEPVVTVGGFPISAELIKAYIKNHILHTNTSITERSAAYGIAALFFAERGLAPTGEALSEQAVRDILAQQESDYAADREANEAYCKQVGLSAREYRDMAAITDVDSYLRTRYSRQIFSLMEQSYRSKHSAGITKADGSPGEVSSADVTAYYDEYLQIFVRRLEFKELRAGVLDEIRAEMDAWVAKLLPT